MGGGVLSEEGSKKGGYCPGGRPGPGDEVRAPLLRWLGSDPGSGQPLGGGVVCAGDDTGTNTTIKVPVGLCRAKVGG